MFEFKDTDIPPHNCGSILDTSKVSNTRTNLIYVVCKRVIGWWEPAGRQVKEYPKDSQYYTDSLLKKLR